MIEKMSHSIIIIATISAFLIPASSTAQLTVSVESGIAFTQYNNVKAPNQDNQQGSFFSLADDFQEVQTPIYFRAEAKYLIASKHTIEITAAPLVVESQSFEGSSLLFENTSFEDDNVNGRYQFNTYRASYRYRILKRPKFLIDLGASILVRDASITISQNNTSVSNTDLGFVPLISLYAQYNINPKLQTILKGDALVGPVGRAEDFFLGFQYIPFSTMGIKVGYRLIEGGADVEQVYNFAFFHFASVGLNYTL